MRVVAASFTLAGVLFGLPAFADDAAEAARLAEEGARALETHHFQTAFERFWRAELLAERPAYALGLARAEAGLNKVVAAERTYASLLDDAASQSGPGDAQIREDAKKEVAEVRSRIAHVTIRVLGPSAPYVLLDSAPLGTASTTSHPIDPGSHVVRATARGFQSAEAYFTVLEGGEISTVLAMSEDRDSGHPNAHEALPPDASPVTKTVASPLGQPGDESPSAYRIGAYLSFGTAGAALLLGVVESLHASNVKSELSTMCAPSCTASQVDQIRSLTTVATVGYVVAGLSAATGIALLVFEPKPSANTPASATISPYLGVGTVGAFARF